MAVWALTETQSGHATVTLMMTLWYSSNAVLAASCARSSILFPIASFSPRTSYTPAQASRHNWGGMG